MGPDDLAELGWCALGDRLGWKTSAGEAIPKWNEASPRLRNAVRIMAATMTGDRPGLLEDEGLPPGPALEEDDDG